MGPCSVSRLLALCCVLLTFKCAFTTEPTPTDPVKFDNFTLFRVWSQSSRLLIDEGFHDALILSRPGVRFPSYELIVPPGNKFDFLTDLKARQWSYEELNPNVQESIDKELQQNTVDTRAGEPYGWDRYQSYDETTAWMKQLPEQYPEQVTLFNLGKSHQNRDTYGVKLSRRPNNPAVFIEAGVHSREWISPATSTFIFNQLLTNNDTEVQRLATEYDWNVVPLVNPDGYVFTRTNRMWRKNMRRNLLCVGTDLNRNWNYHWSEVGASPNACTDLFAGSEAMSEVETRNLDNFMRTIHKSVKLYLSMHAYSQLLLWPEGHTPEEIPEVADYKQIGNKTVEAIAKRYGTKYTMGSINEVIYPASGATIDYMRATYKIPLAFCFELRPEGGSRTGFLLDSSQIIPTGEETFDGVAAMIRERETLGYFKMD